MLVIPLKYKTTTSYTIRISTPLYKIFIIVNSNVLVKEKNTRNHKNFIIQMYKWKKWFK